MNDEWNDEDDDGNKELTPNTSPQNASDYVSTMYLRTFKYVCFFNQFQ